MESHQELPFMELQTPKNYINYFIRNEFENHKREYGNIEWTNLEEVRKETEKLERSKIIGYIPIETAREWISYLAPEIVKEGITEEWKKIYIASYYKKPIFCLLCGIAIC